MQTGKTPVSLEEYAQMTDEEKGNKEYIIILDFEEKIK